MRWAVARHRRGFLAMLLSAAVTTSTRTNIPEFDTTIFYTTGI